LSLTFVKAAKLAISKMTNSPIGVTTSDWTQGDAVAGFAVLQFGLQIAL
jgi:hypothetical protein